MLAMEKEKSPFGAWLQQVCARRGWNQSDLVARTGVSSGLVNDWWHGRKVPGPRSWGRIADALQLPVEVVEAAAGYGEASMTVDQLVLLSELQRVSDTLSRVTSDVAVMKGELDVVVHGRTIDVVGRIPATSDTFRSIEGLVASVQVLEEHLRGAQSPVAVCVVSDEWKTIGIYLGDYVIVETEGFQRPANGQLVVIRIGDEHVLRRWRACDERVELLGADDRIVNVLRHDDDYAVFGLFVTFIPAAPR